MALIEFYKLPKKQQMTFSASEKIGYLWLWCIMSFLALIGMGALLFRHSKSD
jgi:hypothetical protein